MTEPSTVQDYLQFLSYSLSPDSQSVPSCAERMDWAGLLQFAEKQSVVGVYWQGGKADGRTGNEPAFRG